jgi:hypothetical protein
VSPRNQRTIWAVPATFEPRCREPSAEADYIHGESLRFAELRAGLLDPSFASVPFLGWLQAFERASNARVGPGAAVWTGSPEGTGILAAQRGDSPFALTTQIRTLWR